MNASTVSMEAPAQERVARPGVSPSLVATLAGVLVAFALITLQRWAPPTTPLVPAFLATSSFLLLGLALGVERGRAGLALVLAAGASLALSGQGTPLVALGVQALAVAGAIPRTNSTSLGARSYLATLIVLLLAAAA